MPKAYELLKDAIVNKKIDQAKGIINANAATIDTLMDDIRKYGTFRCSNYEFKINHLLQVVKYIRETSLISAKNKDYLNSIITLCCIGGTLRKAYELSQKPEHDIKEYLAFVDYLFLLRNINVSHSLGSVERMVEYISTIYFCHKKCCIKEKNHKLDFKKLIQMSATLDLVGQLKEYKEFEVLVDCFDYNAFKKGTTIIIESKLEKYIRIGYILAENAYYADAFRAIKYGDYTKDLFSKFLLN